MKLRVACVLIGLLSLVPWLGQLTSAQTSAQTASAVPRLIRFGGAVKDLNGSPMTGLLGITFALYSDQTGGAPLWLETQNVEPDTNGRYSVLLGSTKPEGLPTDLFTSTQAHWVGVQISGQAEQPRVLLVSAPYALKAADAETIGGLPPSAFVMASPERSGGKASVPATETQNYIPLFVDGSGDLGNSILYQSGTTAVGIGTTTPAATLEVNGTTKFDGAATFAAGQTFPGTVTGVTAGTGISVTGSKTNPTIGINTTFANQYYPQLNAANTFTKNQTVNGTMTATSFSGSGTGVTNVNAALLNGLSSSAFQPAGSYAGLGSNTFTGNQNVTGNITATGSISGATAIFSGVVTENGALLPAAGTATASQGYNSQPMDAVTSAYNSTAGQAQNQDFRWQTEPVGNNTSSPSGKLNLLFGANGTAPAETGFSLANTGIITFATGQTFPGGGGTITGVTAGTDLTGGGTTGNVTLNVDTTKIPQLSAANAFTGNQTVTGNMTASGEVQGGVVNATGTFDLGGLPFAFGTPYTGNGLGNSMLGFAGNQTMTGDGNVGTGYGALLHNTTGEYNVAIGLNALMFNTANYNTAVGDFALSESGMGPSSNANNNTAVGYAAAANNTSGDYNTATGYYALALNGTGINNSAVGALALSNNTVGNYNTAMGYIAGVPMNSIAGFATAIGAYSVIGASYATAVGSYATATGTDSTAVGNAAAATAINSTAVGQGAVASANNALVLGQTLKGSPGTYFVNAGIGTDTPRSVLEASVSKVGALGPTIMLTNPGGGSGAATSIDFNSYLYTQGTYNPAARIVAVDQNNSSDSILFQSNIPGNFNNGLQTNMQISSTGQIGIPASTPSDQLYVAAQTAINAVFAQGSNGSGTTGGGIGVAAIGGNSTGSAGPGTGVFAFGGSNSGSAEGGDGVLSFGGNSSSSGTEGGAGINGFGGTGVSSGGPFPIGGDGQGGTFQGANSSSGCCIGDGIVATAGSGLAGAFSGDVDVSGTLSANLKDFKIDHPLDPANKYLIHSSVESSEMMNIYTGNVITDSQGLVTVQLPDWFEALNTDFRYQLTVIGQFAQAIVSSEISHHQFAIRTDKPNVKVSWQVTGVRQDAYAKAKPLVVEQAKDARERGHYIHPELYGAPEQQSIEWARHPETMKRMQEMKTRQLAASQPPTTTTRAEARPLAVPPDLKPRSTPESPATPLKPSLLQKQPAPRR
jgi:hypothetical protein